MQIRLFNEIKQQQIGGPASDMLIYRSPVAYFQ